MGEIKKLQFLIKYFNDRKWQGNCFEKREKLDEKFFKFSIFTTLIKSRCSALKYRSYHENQNSSIDTWYVSKRKWSRIKNEREHHSWVKNTATAAVHLSGKIWNFSLRLLFALLAVCYISIWSSSWRFHAIFNYWVISLVRIKRSSKFISRLLSSLERSHLTPTDQHFVILNISTFRHVHEKGRDSCIVMKTQVNWWGWRWTGGREVDSNRELWARERMKILK